MKLDWWILYLDTHSAALSVNVKPTPRIEGQMSTFLPGGFNKFKEYGSNWIIPNLLPSLKLTVRT